MIKGFSKLSKSEKIEFLLQHYLGSSIEPILQRIQINDTEINELIEGFSENVISTYYFPYSVAPNFLVDNHLLTIPMVTEESSVVAAAAKSASYWASRGGFKTEVLGTGKEGQVHFKFAGDKVQLNEKVALWLPDLKDSVEGINAQMLKRGGGLKNIELLDKTSDLADYFQLNVSFNTCDAMGANYMNSCLEGIAAEFDRKIKADSEIDSGSFTLIMSILSNYSPGNSVKVWVECPVGQLGDPHSGVHPHEFANKFCDAVEIAHVSTYRAVTHNKGFYNGVDAVALATGNDWRAIEANGHAFAASDGKYRSLSSASVLHGNFRFEATVPMQVGTVGGVTALHPLAKLSMQILQKPSASRLMAIMACAGLASNFGAVKSLITTGIQKGHMKMHLTNILASFQATPKEFEMATTYFRNKTISHSAVEKYIADIRDS